MPTPATPTVELARFFGLMSTLSPTSEVLFRRPRYGSRKELYDHTVELVVDGVSHVFPLRIESRSHDAGLSQTNAIFELCQLINLFLMEKCLQINFVQARDIDGEPLQHLNKMLVGKMGTHQLEPEQEWEFYTWMTITCQVTES